jgi:hypothetical protein
MLHDLTPSGFLPDQRDQHDTEPGVRQRGMPDFLPAGKIIRITLLKNKMHIHENFSLFFMIVHNTVLTMNDTCGTTESVLMRKKKGKGKGKGC